MPYVIDRYSSNSFDSGKFPLTINDGTVNSTTTSVRLLGRGTSNYGEIVAETLVHMLEHFTGTTAPTNPITGQVWFEADPSTSGSGRLRVYNGTTWEVVGGVNIGLVSARPSSGQSSSGDLYFATDTGLLYVFNGSSWETVGADAVVVQNTAPSGASVGDLWYD